MAYAQSVVPDPIQYVVSPEEPGPNQQVTIEVNGVGQFLGNSTITWKQDGSVVSSAANQENFSFTTGGIGSPTIIDISINSPTQGNITHEFIFNPSVINLVWEADTYTPLLYKGKSLYSGGSNLKVVAYPTVMLSRALVPASKLSFQWKRNDTPVTASSGLGKNVFSFQGDQLQTEEDISVTVYSGTVPVGESDIVIPVSSPQVLLYAQDPLRGELLDAAFQGSVPLGQTETTLKAEPYFFSNASVKNSRIQYTWNLNNEETTGPQSAQGLLTLRQTGSGSGSADLSVSIQNTDSSKYAQAANANLTLVFGDQGGSALSKFFGL